MRNTQQYNRYKWMGFLSLIAGLLLLLFGRALAKALVLPSTPPQQAAQAYLEGQRAMAGANQVVMVATILLLMAGILSFAWGTILQKRHERATGEKETDASPFVKIWVWTHIVIISIKCLPSAPSDIKGAIPKRRPFGTEYALLAADAIKPTLDLYLWPTGFWQGWEMFAPNPSDWEGYATAVIYFKDGTRKEYSYPRMYALGIGIKYLKERYRKFLERAGNDQFRWLWPRFAMRVALENYTDRNNPPVGVQLWRHAYIVPPTLTFPGYLSGLLQGRMIGSNPKMPPYKDQRYFPDETTFPASDATWPIDQRKLEEMAKL